MTTARFSQRNRYGVRRRAAFLAIALVALLALKLPGALAAPTVSVTAAGDARVSGSGTGSPPIFFADFDTLDFTPVADPYQNTLAASENLNSTHIQVHARALLGSTSSSDEYSVSTHVSIGSFIDPIFSSAQSSATSLVEKSITVDQRYRYAFTWTRTTYGAATYGVDATITDLSSFSGALGVVTGHVFPLPFPGQAIPAHRETGYLFTGDSAHMNSALRIESATSPFPPLSGGIMDEMELRLLPPGLGMEESNPLIPEVLSEGLDWIFENVPTGLWFDPASSSALSFRMTSGDTLFTSILDFPSGLSAPLTVSAEGRVLGTYGPDAALDFVALLGHGVSDFMVSGITPPAATGVTPGFALQLAFNTATADFAIQAVPLPAGLPLFATALLGLAMRRRMPRSV